RMVGHGWPAAARQAWMPSRAGEHATAGTPPCPKPTNKPRPRVARIFIRSQESGGRRRRLVFRRGDPRLAISDHCHPAMPIYAYRCAACGHDFDRLQKLSDPDPDACPSCGATGQVRRQVTAPSFRLAGSGWYETDFKKDGDRKRNLVEGTESAAAKPEAKADANAKPAAEPRP